MAIDIPAISEETLTLFQKQVQQQNELLITDMFAQSLINKIRELEMALPISGK